MPAKWRGDLKSLDDELQLRSVALFRWPSVTSRSCCWNRHSQHTRGAMENKGGNLARITAEAEAQLAAALAKQEADRRAASKGVAHYYDGATEKAMWYNPGHRHQDRPHRPEAQSAVVSKLQASAESELCVTRRSL